MLSVFLITCCRSSVCPTVYKLFTYFFFFSRTTKPILTRLGTKHRFGKGIQIFLNIRAYPFLKGKLLRNIEKRVGSHKIFFSRTTTAEILKFTPKCIYSKDFKLLKSRPPDQCLGPRRVQI